MMSASIITAVKTSILRMAKNNTIYIAGRNMDVMLPVDPMRSSTADRRMATSPVNISGKICTCFFFVFHLIKVYERNKNAVS